MADLINPFANPYLPTFANQRPVINNQAQTLPTPNMKFSGITYGQIHYVTGFDGADVHASSLANGASEIISESDPNLARIYVTAKDANGQCYVKGYNLIPVERPKHVTMDDLNSKISELLDRMNKLEEEKVNEPKPNSTVSDARNKSNVNYGKGNVQSSSINNSAGGSK